jgi:hypothetical protein
MTGDKPKIQDLEWALCVYSDIIKFGVSSRFIDSKNECVEVLENFEEYEKCFDIKKIFTDSPEGLLNKIKKK